MPSVKVVLACAIVLLLGIASCGSLPQVLYGKRIAGQVVDAATGAPLAGVHVAYLWESPIIPKGFTGHNSRDVCYHAAAAMTDASGRFEVEPWREWSTYRVVNGSPSALVYVRAYQPLQITVKEDAGSPTAHPHQRYSLKPFAGTVDDRLHQLFWNLANRSCHYGKQSQKSLYPMLKAIYAEAASIARTEDHRSTAANIASIAAVSALALDPNSDSNDALVDTFIRNNLQ